MPNRGCRNAHVGADADGTVTLYYVHLCPHVDLDLHSHSLCKPVVWGQSPSTTGLPQS